MSTSSKSYHVSVFGSSSDKTPKKYIDVAYELGGLIAKHNCVCVNGGGVSGVMGAMNRGCKSNGGEIIGVFHQRFEGEEDSKHITSFIYAEGTGLAERKKQLFDLADCIIIAPGGVGTFDEMWDCVCCKKLKMNGLDHKPICLLNYDGFFDGSIIQLQRAYEDEMLYDVPESYFHVVTTPQAALDYCLNEINRLNKEHGTTTSIDTTK